MPKGEQEEAASPDGGYRKIVGRSGGSDTKEELSESRKYSLLAAWRSMRSRSDSRRGRRRWYKNPIIWIPLSLSVLTLIVSAIAAIISSADFRFQQRTRLTTLVQQLSEVRVKMAELTLEYGDRAPTLNIELGQPLTEEAFSLLREVRDVNSFEKTIIAQSFIETNQPDRAEPIAAEAEREADNLLEEVSAARVLANAYFNQGKHGEGRRAYSQALEYADKGVGVDSLIKLQHKIDTELNWISSELRIYNCLGAKERMRQLEFNLGSFPKAPAGFEARIRPARDLVNACS